MKTYEGAIISCDRENHVYRYLVEDKGRILHVGDELPAAYQGAPREVLGERALLPCFGDTHLHFASYALFNAGLDVRAVRSLPEMCEQIQKFTRENNDKIIMGFRASTHFVMVILNKNPLTLKPNELLGLKVENLLLKGEPYQKGQGILILATF